jgi:hypothetical protein
VRHGFAGASREWGCPVFGAAVFFDRRVPRNWPSGVYWTRGDVSTQVWGYDDNPLRPAGEFRWNINEGMAVVRIFPII